MYFWLDNCLLAHCSSSSNKAPVLLHPCVGCRKVQPIGKLFRPLRRQAIVRPAYTERHPPALPAGDRAVLHCLLPSRKIGGLLAHAILSIIHWFSLMPSGGV